ncbi:MAG: DUF4198 domain-containing protein [Gemmatimonadetes bacterium]|nr:DUF4198 domain-containing protein [Gemmatimonadota bacterium]
MRRLLLAVLALSIGALPLRAHDLFLTMRTFFVPAETPVVIHALNGTFTSSEAVVARGRLRDVSVVSPAGRTHPDTTAWQDQGDTSVLTVRTGPAGTYVVGMATAPRVLALDAASFNAYLASEGVPEVLAARRRDGELTQPARERYAKNAKVLLQVGDQRTDGATGALGYAAELVPLRNPYALRAGANTVLAVRALVDGTPQAHLIVQVGGRGARGVRVAPRSLRTDSAGVAQIPLRYPGRWYIKFIHMRRLTNDPDADYASHWATLTFEVR